MLEVHIAFGWIELEGLLEQKQFTPSRFQLLAQTEILRGHIDGNFADSVLDTNTARDEIVTHFVNSIGADSEDVLWLPKERGQGELETRRSGWTKFEYLLFRIGFVFKIERE